MRGARLDRRATSGTPIRSGGGPRRYARTKILLEPPAAPVVFPDLAGAPTRGGGASAPVTVVEFGDFQCPPCGRVWKIVDEALRPYGDRVRYVFRNSPLAFHENAQKAAEAARAAQAQGRFFEYADVLFKNQKALDASSLKRYAAETGLDVARFAADLDGGRYAADVLLERRAAVRAGCIGTPTFLVNGAVLRPNESTLEGIRAAVDAALARVH